MLLSICPSSNCDGCAWTLTRLAIWNKIPLRAYINRIDHITIKWKETKTNAIVQIRRNVLHLTSHRRELILLLALLLSAVMLLFNFLINFNTALRVQSCLLIRNRRMSMTLHWEKKTFSFIRKKRMQPCYSVARHFMKELQ